MSQFRYLKTLTFDFDFVGSHSGVNDLQLARVKPLLPECLKFIRDKLGQPHD
ncbi:hypothetical protein SCP_0900150 [Sparassis crispa]|uniref:Uncharacterized protein n=1 Tax=Sparassis crispa TaxID=139825 RepID=A0A401GV89_9APHY|nr:hypothetical protein SCP_0900150 [Sparassis crispa]GBE86138.1 hypothetical protein SCP_0900150 [Sparassis crispa]